MLSRAESERRNELGPRSAVAAEQINRIQTRPADVKHLGICSLSFFWSTDEMKKKRLEALVGQVLRFQAGVFFFFFSCLMSVDGAVGLQAAEVDGRVNTQAPLVSKVHSMLYRSCISSGDCNFLNLIAVTLSRNCFDGLHWGWGRWKTQMFGHIWTIFYPFAHFNRQVTFSPK